jgi:hypothetical protein
LGQCRRGGGARSVQKWRRIAAGGRTGGGAGAGGVGGGAGGGSGIGAAVVAMMGQRCIALFGWDERGARSGGEIRGGFGTGGMGHGGRGSGHHGWWKEIRRKFEATLSGENNNDGDSGGGGESLSAALGLLGKTGDCLPGEEQRGRQREREREKQSERESE